MKFLLLFIIIAYAFKLSRGLIQPENSLEPEAFITREYQEGLICLLFEKSDDEKTFYKRTGNGHVGLDKSRYNRHKKQAWRCELQRHLGKRLTLDVGSKFEQVLEKCTSGRTTIIIQGGITHEGRIIVPDDGSVQIFATRWNGGNRSTGARDVLVLKVRANDRFVKGTLEEISASIFNLNQGEDQCSDLINLQSQYFACSYGKLQLKPVAGISGGVAEVMLNTNITGRLNEEIEIMVINQALADDLPINSAHHVMICLPPGTINENGNPDWTLYGEIDGKYTVYNNEWCQYTSGHMHGIGHNLNLRQSGDVTETMPGISSEYGDQTCYMGLSYEEIGRPRLCFNAAKSWQLGWYSDCHVIFDITKNNLWKGKLIGVVDYKNGRDCSRTLHVLLKVVEPDTANAVYLTYNRKKGVNADTGESGNLVTVVSEATGRRSDLLFSLDEGQTCAIWNFGYSGKDLFLGVTSTVKTTEPNYANVCLSTGSTGRVLPHGMEFCLEELMFHECDRFKDGNEGEAAMDVALRVADSERTAYATCQKQQYNECRAFLFDIKEHEKEGREMVQKNVNEEDENEGLNVSSAGGNNMSKGGSERTVHNFRELWVKECLSNHQCKRGIEKCKGKRCVSLSAIRLASLGVDGACGIFSGARNTCGTDGMQLDQHDMQWKTSFPSFTQFTCPNHSAYCFYLDWAKRDSKIFEYRSGEGHNTECVLNLRSIESKAIWKFCEAFVGAFDGLPSIPSCACDCAAYVQKCCAPQDYFYC